MKALSNSWMVLPLTVALLGLVPEASAQETKAAGKALVIVNVDLRNARVLQNIANHLSVNVSNVPVTVQAPVSVAAVVCDVSVDILSTAFRRGGSNCFAQSSSAALNRIVQRVINLQTQ